MPDSVRFVNARLVYDSEIVRQDLCVEHGKIVDPSTECSHTIDCQGLLISSGFIDLQVNGLNGVDLTTNLSDWPKVSEGLCRFGVTSFLAAILSQPLDRYHSLVKDVSFTGTERGAQCLGLHLEGPHLHKSKRGAHAIDHVNEICDVSFWKKFFKNGLVKMMTLAPELTQGLDLVELLRSKGIIASCGHSEAPFDIMQKASELGLNMATHLYNGMSVIHHRNPGPVGFILGTQKLMYSIIVDGIHVHPAMVRMAWNAHPKGMIVISDTNAAVYASTNGSSSAQSTIAGRPIEVLNGRTVVEGTDVLAGSTFPLNIMVHNLQKFTGCTFPEAIATVTTHPALLLGLENTKGRLLPGYDADLVILDPNTSDLVGHEILATYVNGQLSYCNEDFKIQDFS